MYAVVFWRNSSTNVSVKLMNSNIVSFKVLIWKLKRFWKISLNNSTLLTVNEKLELKQNSEMLLCLALLGLLEFATENSSTIVSYLGTIIRWYIWYKCIPFIITLFLFLRLFGLVKLSVHSCRQNLWDFVTRLCWKLSVCFCYFVASSYFVLITLVWRSFN